MLLQSTVGGVRRVTLASLDHQVFLAWMVDLVVTDSPALLEPKALLVPCW